MLKTQIRFIVQVNKKAAIEKKKELINNKLRLGLFN